MKSFNKDSRTVVYEGRFIRFLKQGSWEFVERSNCSGIVIVLALTDMQKVILTEQFRLPVGKNVIEFPAGLVSDEGRDEPETAAAERELLEETGYQADRLVKVTEGPVSAGLTTGLVTVFKAEKVKKIADGGGDHSEDITVHEVALDEVDNWLCERQRQGVLVDPKVYAGLYFLKNQEKD